MKTCSYENYGEMAGMHRPSRLVMEDACAPGEQLVLDYANMKLRDLLGKVFPKDYMKKLE